MAPPDPTPGQARWSGERALWTAPHLAVTRTPNTSANWPSRHYRRCRPHPHPQPHSHFRIEAEPLPGSCRWGHAASVVVDPLGGNDLIAIFGGRQVWREAVRTRRWTVNGGGWRLLVRFMAGRAGPRVIAARASSGPHSGSWVARWVSISCLWRPFQPPLTTAHHPSTSFPRMAPATSITTLISGSLIRVWLVSDEQSKQSVFLNFSILPEMDLVRLADRHHEPPRASHRLTDSLPHPPSACRGPRHGAECVDAAHTGEQHCTAGARPPRHDLRQGHGLPLCLWRTRAR